VAKGNGELKLVGAIKNSLLYCVVDRRVSMGQGGMTLIGAI